MGTIETFTLSVKPLTQSPRRVWVYLPSGYEKDSRKYDVLYMFDGHNLFDDNVATYGRSWRLKDTLDRMKLPLVIVGQDCNHSGNRRLEEYCPVPLDPNATFDNLVEARGLKSKGTITAKWFAEKLKPYCEEHYRIFRERSHVGIGGSSMGGLMSLYMIAAYNDVYSRALCFSSTLDITFAQLRPVLEQADMDQKTRVFLNFGENEGKGKHFLAENVETMLLANRILQEKGVSSTADLLLHGKHNEASWDRAFPDAIRFLWPEFFQDGHDGMSL